jgi:hypothetical protein
MTHNPYAVPEAKVADIGPVPVGSAVTSERLYTHQQIAIAAFLGSFLAAGWFFGKNFAALGQPQKRLPSLALGLAAALAAGAIGYFLPDQVPHVVTGLACFFAARAYAEQKFGKEVTAHLAAGGQRGSWWVVVGVSLLFAFALIALLLAVFLIFFREYLP